MREAALREYPQVASIVRPLMQSLTRDKLQRLNARVQVNGEAAEAVAQDYLHAAGFIR